MSSRFRAFRRLFVLALAAVSTVARGADRAGLLILVPDGADLAAVRAARATTSPAPPLVGAARAIALDGGLSVAADQTAAEASEAGTLVLLPGPASPALDALLRARRATAETILLVEPARPELMASLTGGAALVLTGHLDAIRKLLPGIAPGTTTPPAPAPPATLAPPAPLAAPAPAPAPATAAAAAAAPGTTEKPAPTPARGKTFDRYFGAATPTPKAK